MIKDIYKDYRNGLRDIENKAIGDLKRSADVVEVNLENLGPGVQEYFKENLNGIANDIVVIDQDLIVSANWATEGVDLVTADGETLNTFYDIADREDYDAFIYYIAVNDNSTEETKEMAKMIKEDN